MLPYSYELHLLKHASLIPFAKHWKNIPYYPAYKDMSLYRFFLNLGILEFEKVFVFKDMSLNFRLIKKA